MRRRLLVLPVDCFAWYLAFELQRFAQSKRSDVEPGDAMGFAERSHRKRSEGDVLPAQDSDPRRVLKPWLQERATSTARSVGAWRLQLACKATLFPMSKTEVFRFLGGPRHQRGTFLSRARQSLPQVPNTDTALRSISVDAGKGKGVAPSSALRVDVIRGGSRSDGDGAYFSIHGQIGGVGFARRHRHATMSKPSAKVADSEQRTAHKV